ncbi:Hvo_1808 family surface protein [Halolamina sp. C58]|uniref:Hvo_1808 family surface protein n=1 Tax=Halolamina sp. C58 TaxID=3421640 RepID=UPI003EBB771D
MRRVATVLAVTLVVLAGLAPLAAAAPAGADAAVSGVAATEQSTPTNESAPPDPETDRIGWENGYWYNESIDVNQSDGLTQAELNATVARAMARVEVIRELEFNTTVPVDIVSRSAFANSSGNSSYSEAFRAFDNAKFEALFLIGEEEGSLAVQQSNRGATVGGYYSPAADSIVLVTDNETTLQVDELTLGHELVHAVQDQKFDLGNFSSQTRDGANANSGLIEGDANYVQQQYRERCGEGGAWNGTCLRPEASGGGGGGGPANIGVYFVNYQPYSDGPTFIAAQKRQGGWDAVNDLYDAPPQSAEQVIHPERYGTDPPTEVELADEHGENWERIRPESRLDYAEVGQAGVASMFVYPWYAGRSPQGYDAIPNFRNTWFNYTDSGDLSPIDPLNYGFDAAAGWDGDRMHFYQNDAGEGGYVWRLVWDSDAEAIEFRDAYEELLAYWGAEQIGEGTYRIEDGPFADAFHVTVAGDTVTIVNAPTVEQLSEVRGSVDAGAETPTAEPTPTDAPATESISPTVTEPSVTAESPGFSAVTALVALLGGALLFRRR